MNACLTTSLMQQFHRLFGVLVLSLISCQIAAHAAPAVDSKKMLRPITSVNHADAGIKLTLLGPRAYPDALPANGGKITVLFSVPLLGKAKSSDTVYLRRIGDKQSIAMNDLGKDGDFIAKDGIYGVYVQIDTDKVKPDSCLNYETFVNQERAKLVSPPLRLCVSSFPVGTATSNTKSPVIFPDGAKVVADEILLYATPTTSAATIRELAGSINASVVGTILSRNVYQLKLSSPVSANRLLEIASLLRSRSGKVGVSVNAIGHGALAINDPEFSAQHGLKLVVEHDVHGVNTNAWDAGGTGNGVTVVVLDTGLDLTHPDLNAAWTCQAVPASPLPSPVPVVLIPCTDTTVGTTPAGHGTEVAGVIAAKTNNIIPTGVAGLAYGSTIHSIKMRDYTILEMQHGFDTAAGYIGIHSNAKVINASFYGEWDPVSWVFSSGLAALCTSINSAVVSGFGAVVVNSAGNDGRDGNFYPARCNDTSGTVQAGLTHKELLITVSNSASVVTAACGNVAVNQRCAAAVPSDPNLLGSNYGAWVDIAAPGSEIRTTTLVSAGNYASPTGTSFSAPLVSGAAGILASCGVPLNQIKTILKGPPEFSPGANVYVPYPSIGSSTKTPRLDIYNALQTLAPTAANLSTAESYTEGVPLNLVDIVVSSGIASCATITVTLTLPAAAGSLSSGGVVSAAGVWTASGTVASINALLAGLTFTPSANYNSNFNITTSVSDGISTITGSKPMTGIAVNNAPVNTVPAAQTAADGIPKVISGISVFDVDAGATPITMTLTATHGTISVNTGVLTGVPAANITGNNSASITLTGSQSQINATLANATGVTYTASLSGAATLTVVTNDNGASGGPAQFDTDVININVAAVNHPPSATNMSAPQSYTEDVSLNLTGIVVTDPDVGDVITATLTLANPAAGMLSSGGVNSVGGVWTTSGSVASVNALLAGLVFVPSANFNSNFSITTSVSDGIAPAITGSKMMTGIPVSDIPTYAVGIDGTRTKGFTLNAIIIGLVNPDGWSATGYQWRRSDTPVGPPPPVDISLNGTNSSYILVQDDVDKYMSVCVTYTSGVLTPVTICSGTDATAIGDPHINTVDGLHYDFQSAGEFVALRGSDGMEIQVRQTPVSTAAPLADNYSMLPVGVSVNTAVAARVGKYHVTYQMKDNTNAVSSGLELKVEHNVVTPTADGLDLGSGGRVATAPGNGIQIDFPDGTTMVATPYWWAWNNVWYLDVSVMHTSAYNGLMGARYKGSWLPRLSDGSALGAMPVAMHERYVELYEKFADSWRVNDDTTLFDYVPGTSTKTFTFKEWPKENGPYVIGNGPVAKPLARNIATQLCRGVVGKNEKADCVFDVMVTGNRGIAKSHLLSQQIRTGLTSITVRDDRGISRDKEMVTFTATVARHAAPTRMELDRKGGALTGAVQFTINGNSVGKPVRLDARGQAQLQLPRLKVEKQTIGARYIPVKGSVFFPSSSFESARLVVEGKR